MGKTVQVPPGGSITPGAGRPLDGESELIRQAAAGDERAFAALVRRYEGTVYGFSYRICRDRERASQTLQDTFISVYRKLRTFDGRSRFSTWLYTIAANNCRMGRRRRKWEHLTESLDNPPAEARDRQVHLASGPASPADMVLTKELRRVLEEAVLKLPMEYRLTFILRDAEGKSTAETARILGIGGEAVKSRLRRARSFLRRTLEPYVEDREPR
ncbi:MAG: sigma-70 family RNA polymerase sigma factor [Bacteroidota bacterium]